MVSVAQRVVETWRTTGISLNAGASRTDLEDLSALLQLDVPADICEFYGLANGMPDLVYDDHQVRFWSISKIREEHQHGTWGDAEIGFADFLINSWRFIFRVVDNQVIVVSENVRLGDPMESLGSFSDFLEIYLTDSMRLCIL